MHKWFNVCLEQQIHGEKTSYWLLFIDEYVYKWNQRILTVMKNLVVWDSLATRLGEISSERVQMYFH